MDRLTFETGSAYQVEIDGNGRSDKIVANDTVTINGGEVNVSLENDNNLLSQATVESLKGKQYTIMTANNGIRGKFSQVLPQYGFIGTALTYEPNRVVLKVGRSQRAFSDVAKTQNQTAVANAVETLGFGNPVYEMMLRSPTDNAATSVLSQLTGQIHSDATTAHLQHNANLDTMMLERARDEQTGVWVSALNGEQKTRHDGNALGYRIQNTGVAMGYDTQISTDWKVGVAAIFSKNNITSDGSDEAKSKNQSVSLYADGKLASLDTRLGITQSWHDIDTWRRFNVGNFSDNTKAGYQAQSQHIFGELGYAINTPALTLEPFTKIAHTQYHRAGFVEQGGATSLKSTKQTFGNTQSALGVRAKHQWHLANDANLGLSAELGWLHQFNANPVNSHLTFNQGGDAFVVQGVKLPQNSLLLKTGAELSLSPQAKVYLSYQGNHANKYSNNAIDVGVKFKF